MTLSRAQLVQVAAADLVYVLRWAGVGAIDESGDLKEPVDRALRQLGVLESGLATATIDDAQRERAVAYVRYALMDRALFTADPERCGKAQVDLLTEVRKQYYDEACRFGWHDFTPTPLLEGRSADGTEDPMFSIDDVTQLVGAGVDLETE